MHDMQVCDECREEVHGEKCIPPLHGSHNMCNTCCWCCFVRSTLTGTFMTTRMESAITVRTTRFFPTRNAPFASPSSSTWHSRKNDPRYESLLHHSPSLLSFGKSFVHLNCLNIFAEENQDSTLCYCRSEGSS